MANKRIWTNEIDLATADIEFEMVSNGKIVLIPAHKCYLVVHSPVFRMLVDNDIPIPTKIQQPYFDIESFVVFLELLYGFKHLHQINYDFPKIASLMYLTDKYAVNFLVEDFQVILCSLVDKNIQTILWVSHFANRYIGYDKLKKHCATKIFEYGTEIMNMDEFVLCRQRDVIEQILGTAFKGRDEVNVFARSIKWAENVCKDANLDPETQGNIRSQLGNCFNLIKFESMTSDQFIACLCMNTNVFKPGEIKELFGDKYKMEFVERKCHDRAMKPLVIKTMTRDVQTLEKMFGDQSTADVFFILTNDNNQETERLAAHKCVLANTSKKFANMLKTSNEIHITHVSADVFKSFLRLIYVSNWQRVESMMGGIPKQHIDTILILAKEYEVPDVIRRHGYYLGNSLNERNVMAIFETSCKHSISWLRYKCREFMQEKLKEAMEISAFSGVDQATLKAVLELKIWKNNSSVVDSCIEWAIEFCGRIQLDSKDPEVICIAFGDALNLIPFPTMGQRALTNDEILKAIADRIEARSQFNSRSLTSKVD